MTHVSKLTLQETDELVERLCSVYNIHPTFTCLQYLQALILHPKPCIKRRIRIAESCDLGRTVLYLLTRIESVSQRISCIEMFTNVYLKFHAYLVLYACVDDETQVQIMKNLFRLRTVQPFRKKYLDWFLAALGNPDYSYKIKANCADFMILNSEKNSVYTQRGREFLKLNRKNINVYAYEENVHLFVPKPKVLKELLCKPNRADWDDILAFAAHHGFDVDLLVERIQNDKTLLGTMMHTCTLHELMCIIWVELTQDLRLMLLDDIESSEMEEEAWMCTTGYYNRIINVYQSLTLNDYLVEAEKLEEQEFTQTLIRYVNQHLMADEKKEDILDELPNSTEAQRIKYLTFKVHTLPHVIRDLRARYTFLTDDRFDDYFSKAIRVYENGGDM